MIGIACHSRAIGPRFHCRKWCSERIVPQRENACCGVETAEPPTPRIATAVGPGLETKGKSADDASRAPRKLLGFWRSEVQNSMCRQTLDERSEARTKVRFIWPSSGWLACAPIPRRHACQNSCHPATSTRSHHCSRRAGDLAKNGPPDCSGAVGGPSFRMPDVCESLARGSPAEPLIDGLSDCCRCAESRAPDQPRCRPCRTIAVATMASRIAGGIAVPTSKKLMSARPQ